MSSNFNPRSLTSPGTRKGPKTGRKLSNVDFVIAFVKQNGPTASGTIRRELSKFTGKFSSTGSPIYGEYFYTPSRKATKTTRSRAYPGIGKYWTRASNGTVRLTTKGSTRATEILNNSKKVSSRKTVKKTVTRKSTKRTK